VIGTESELAGMIDQTNLEMGASEQEIADFCARSVPFGFRAVCLLPNQVGAALSVLRGTSIGLAACVSFPLGLDRWEVKAREAAELCDLGVDEIDMVVHTGRAREGDLSWVEREVAAVRRAVALPRLLKVIIEVPVLPAELVGPVAVAAEAGGADLVKTSTGYKRLGIRATSAGDVRLLRSLLSPTTGIKAAGGIRSLGQLEEMVEAGATRVGASRGIEIVEEWRLRRAGDPSGC
jgi:deoxyribose-phosphate aldolase